MAGTWAPAESSTASPGPPGGHTPQRLRPEIRAARHGMPARRAPSPTPAPASSSHAESRAVSVARRNLVLPPIRPGRGRSCVPSTQTKDSMNLTGLLHTLLGDDGDTALRSAAADARTGDVTALDLTAPAPLRPFVVGALADDVTGAGRPVLAVTATSREAEDLAEALRCLLPPRTVAEYPSWETLPHERLSPRSDTVGRRLAVLRRLVHPEDHGDEGTGPVHVVVAPVRSVLQPQVAGLAELEPVRVRVGDDLAIDELAERHATAAYTRVELVERRGEFAVRGGIVDIFPPTEEHPLRLD